MVQYQPIEVFGFFILKYEFPTPKGCDKHLLIAIDFELFSLLIVFT